MNYLDFPLLFSSFMLGFLGGVHCVGMCGGLCAAFSLQLPPNISRHKLIILLNLGRLTSYIIIGALFGLFGQLGTNTVVGNEIRAVLFVVAQILLIFAGLYLSGLFAGFAKIESVGKPIWRKLQPIMHKFLPIQSVSGSLIVGALWGWIPCGLVYSVSATALSSGHGLSGALIMLAFGLGTLPNLFAVSLFAAQIKNFFQNKKIRLVAGLIIVLWAVWRLIQFFGILNIFQAA
ncbi:MAG: sulfite exporter TauE/SafE family protein [Neisseriaceae bacterium]|nr:sulfite exporter TauE/SafE family protein [Neisseriaceae bacterium]